MTLLPSRRWRAAGRVASQSFTTLFVGALLLGLLAVATDARAADSGLKVSDPWMRTIIPSRPAAGYFTLSNETGKAHALVGAASPACGMLMLHESIHRNGRERMVMRKWIAVPAHGKVTFAPGGFHLMCMSPKKAQMVPGHKVPVTLRFEDGSSVTVNFPVHGVNDR